MSSWRVIRRSIVPMLLIVALAGSIPGVSRAAAAEGVRHYIVTLSLPDAGKAIRPVGREARQRIRQRAQRTSNVTDRLAAKLGIRPRHRYESAVSGFSAQLTPQQAAQLRAETQVATVRPAQRFFLASQVVPRGIRRVQAAPSGAPGPDVDADIAVLDTGIGPVGGGELDIRGGINCSGDGRGPGAWSDVYPSRHGTHVAGTAAARDNGVGTVGVAPGARLWSVRVFDTSGFGDETTIICGLDWVLSTHGPAPPPGSQPIEVVNMSIQGPRDRSAPEACVGAADPDALHQAVCAVHAAGITMVAAAGNESIDVARVSPAGYDQVITVGAISDFDGQGGSKRASDCRFYSREVDDTYARYSNHGADVDILAPGTCVSSTYPSPSGDATALLTGTSMSTPHVTGAVARYLAAHPGTSPTQMRHLVRAAGRLDWRLKTDPWWSGVNSMNEPNRVLDVAALMGAPGLRIWAFPASFKVAGTDRTRRVRVDVQRLGGYDGNIELELEQLPGAVGSSRFDRPGRALAGLTGLGARLTLALKPKGPDGRHDLQVRAQGSGATPQGSRSIDLLIDRTGPDISGFGARVRGGRTRVVGDRVSTAIEWTAHDTWSSVSDHVLERRIGGGAWRTISRGSRHRARTIIRRGTSYTFRVRARDSLGNRSTSTRLPLRLAVRDSSSPKLTVAGPGWSSRSRKTAMGGTLLEASSGSPGLVTLFDGSAVGLVAPIGPRRGKIRVRIDGGPWRAIDLRSSRNSDRRVVFSRGLTAGRHELEIEVRRGKAAVDAILILR